MPDGAVSELQDLLDQTASDPSSDPASRIAALRSLRVDLATLTGRADQYINDQELRRESDAMDRVKQHVGARESADVRGNLPDRGLATPEQADVAGLLSHDELDSRTADGTIEEAVRRAPMDWDKRSSGRTFDPTALLAPRELAADDEDVDGGDEEDYEDDDDDEEATDG